MNFAISICVMDRMNSREELLKRIYKERKGVIRWVKHNSGSRNDGEDVLQEAIIIYLSLLDQGKIVDNKDPMPMISTISRRYWLGILRKRKSVFVPLESVATSEDITVDIENALEHESRSQNALNAFELLGDKCKDLLKLFYFNKLDMVKIADQLGFRNEHVARSMKYKCLDKARKLINDK
ncbi:MAG: sigma-70 family RNA polymerase sigma factor [Bacteroidia bacterium]